jgi:hypothetical protein
MEFERAIYRVYERSIDNLRENEFEGSGKFCKLIEYFVLGGCIFSLLVLVVLHTSYVGSPGCLPQVLSQYAHSQNLTKFELKSDELLGINVDYRFSTRVAAAKREQVNYILRVSMAQLRLYLPPTCLQAYEEYQGRRRLSSTQSNLRFASVDALAADHRRHNETESMKGNLTQRFDYVFATEISLVTMPLQMLNQHNFKIINISLVDTPMCYGGAFSQLFIPFGGYDTVMQNNLMASIKKGGILVTATDNYYIWSLSDIVMYQGFPEWLILKTSIVVESLFAFFAISCVTALLVRVLISSGVVLVFPIFWMFGVPVINNRIIALSYPWLGVPIELMRASNLSPTPFIVSHLVKVVIYYMLYEAAQLAFSMWFYNSRYPSPADLWLFGVMLIIEYYSMVFIRSKASIILFPRVSLLLFLLYNFYFFSFPAGFDMLAINTIFLALVYLMLYCARVFEFDAYMRGEVSLDQPRAMYNMVPWPTWGVALPTDDTIFMPVNRYSTSVYATNFVPPPPGPAAPAAGQAPQVEIAELPSSQQDYSDAVSGDEPGDIDVLESANTRRSRGGGISSIFGPRPTTGSGYAALDNTSESRGAR